jgi:multicomponent Na+:H+ antiporter subunit F
VNAWLVTAAVVAAAMVPPTVMTLRGSVEQRLVALQALSILTPVALVAVAVGAGRSVYVDAAIVMALLSFAGGLAYARVLERWL